jgi:hypothetical protein
MKIEERLTNDEFNRALAQFVLEEKLGIRRTQRANVQVELHLAPGCGGSETHRTEATVRIELLKPGEEGPPFRGTTLET